MKANLQLTSSDGTVRSYILASEVRALEAQRDKLLAACRAFADAMRDGAGPGPNLLKLIDALHLADAAIDAAEGR